MPSLTITSSGRPGQAMVLYDRGLDGHRFATVRELLLRAQAKLDGRERCFLLKTERVPFLAQLLAEAGIDCEITSPTIRAELQTAVETSRIDVADVDAAIAQSMARLRPYQVEDTRLLRSKRRWGLFHDMGLGKTPMALLAIEVGGRVLVVCPQSLQLNWRELAHAWRPDFTVSIVRGSAAFRWPTEGEIVVVSYDSIPAPGALPLIGPAMTELYLIADEAHKLKSESTDRTKAYNGVKREVRRDDGRIWILTGTEMPNRPLELWHVLAAADLHIDAWGNFPRFAKDFDLKRSGKRWFANGGGDQAAIISKLRSVSTKRLKRDVLKELPPIVFNDVLVDIDAETKSLCDEVVAHLQQQGVSVADLTATVLATKMQGAGLELWSKARSALAMAKVRPGLEIIQSYEDQGVPLLVFSAHRAPVEIVGKRTGWVKILGGMTATQKQDAKNALQGDAKGCAGTIQAMGEGYTMTRASNLLFFDLHPTPTQNAQAISRSHRFGQTAEKLMVTRLIANHRLDQRLMEILIDKTELVEATTEAAAYGDGGINPGIDLEIYATEPHVPAEAAVTFGTREPRRAFRTGPEKRVADTLRAALEAGEGGVRGALALRLISGGLSDTEWMDLCK